MKPKNEEHLDEEEAVRVIGEGSSNVVTAKRPILGFFSIRIINIQADDLDIPIPTVILILMKILKTFLT